MIALEAQLRQLVQEMVAAELDRRAANQNADELLTVKRAGEKAGLHPGTIRRKVRTGELRAVGSGRLLRIRASDLEAMLTNSRGRERELSPEQRADRDFR